MRSVPQRGSVGSSAESCLDEVIYEAAFVVKSFVGTL